MIFIYFFHKPIDIMDSTTTLIITFWIPDYQNHIQLSKWTSFEIWSQRIRKTLSSSLWMRINLTIGQNWYLNNRIKLLPKQRSRLERRRMKIWIVVVINSWIEREIYITMILDHKEWITLTILKFWSVLFPYFKL
jgi:hypothetical protein